MKDIGVGVIGLGMGASLAKINQVDDSRLEVRAFCASSRTRAENAAREWGIAWSTDSYEDLVSRPDIDVVAVYSPDHLHYEHAAAALRSGKHVLCTKPMTSDPQDALRLVQLVRDTGLVLLVGQTMRFEPQFTTAKQFLDGGSLGEIAWAEAHYVHDMRAVFRMTPWRLHAPQDVLYGGLSHPIDVMRWVLGDIAEVHGLGRQGSMSRAIGYPLVDNYLVNVTFVSGQIGRVLGSYGVVDPPMPMMSLGLYGDLGSLQADYTDQKGGRVRVVEDRFDRLPTATMEFAPETEGAYGHGQTVIRMLRSLETALVGSEHPSPDVVDGARSILTCAAVRESVEERRTVRVPEVDPL